MSAEWLSRLRGTVSQLFQLGGADGVNLKNNSAGLDVRNSADSDFSPVRVSVADVQDYVQLTEGSQTGPPASDTTWFYVEDDGHGFSNVIMLNADGTKLIIGQQLYAIVKNGTGATLTKGTIVSTSTASNNVPLVVKFNSSNLIGSTAVPAFGVVAEDIAHNGFGRAVHFGLLPIDTTSMSFTRIYADPANSGGMTGVAPSAPSPIQEIGIVLTSGVSGLIFVNPQVPNGWSDRATLGNTFHIGQGDAASVVLRYQIASSVLGSLRWTPTATRTLDLPDVTGTLATLDDLEQASPLVIMGWYK